MASEFDKTSNVISDGKLGSATWALNAIAAALWIPIIVYCILIFIMILSGKSIESMTSSALGLSDNKVQCTGNVVSHLRQDMYLPKYPLPHHVETYNHNTVTPWNSIYPRAQLTHLNKVSPILTPATANPPVMDKVIPSSERSR
jgi:hypothetical protein